MADTLLEIRDLKIEATAYPPGEPPKDITIVEGVSLSLERGKVLGLIGESGAGKSTIGLSAMGYGRGGIELTGGNRPSCDAKSHLFMSHDVWELVNKARYILPSCLVDHPYGSAAQIVGYASFRLLSTLALLIEIAKLRSECF